MKNLISQLTSLCPLGQESIDLITGSVTEQHFKKGETILAFDNVCRHLFFINKGLVRGYFLENGKEITTWFATDNELVNELHSFVSQSPSHIAIEVLEDTSTWSISYADLQNLYTQSKEINTLGRLIIEQCYLSLEERNRLFQTKTATWLYHQLITSNPTLANRVSLRHIASYLGITQERLSRIRAIQSK